MHTHIHPPSLKACSYIHTRARKDGSTHMHTSKSEHKRIHAHTDTYRCEYMNIWKDACTYAYTFKHTLACTHAYVLKHTCLYMRTHHERMWIHAFMNTCTHIPLPHVHTRTSVHRCTHTTDIHIQKKYRRVHVATCTYATGSRWLEINDVCGRVYFLAYWLVVIGGFGLVFFFFFFDFGLESRKSL